MSLDREIEDLLAVDPSPEFLATVRQRIASEPAPSTSLVTPGPKGPGQRWPRTLVPLGAVAVAITLGVALWPSSVPVMKPVAPTSEGAFATVAPTTDSARAPVAPAPNRAIAPIAPTNEVAIAPALALPEPEILLSAAESRAIANLLERVQSGRMTPVTQSDGQMAEPSWVDIEPVMIAPLARITPVEGDRQ